MLDMLHSYRMDSLLASSIRKLKFPSCPRAATTGSSSSGKRLLTRSKKLASSSTSLSSTSTSNSSSSSSSEPAPRLSFEPKVEPTHFQQNQLLQKQLRMAIANPKLQTSYRCSAKFPHPYALSSSSRRSDLLTLDPISEEDY